VIQSIYKSVEIELEMRQQADDWWKCDYMLITHPERQVTRVQGRIKFRTIAQAREYALEDARGAIDCGAYRGVGLPSVEHQDELALR
jgi:hypothetical protein